MKHLLVVCTAVASLLAVAAAAQGVGFQAGAAFDPKQIYVGSHIEFPLGSDQIVIRPGISGAFDAGCRRLVAASSTASRWAGRDGASSRDLGRVLLSCWHMPELGAQYAGAGAVLDCNSLGVRHGDLAQVDNTRRVPHTNVCTILE